MKNLSFWIKLLAFILTGYFVFVEYYASAIIWFMIYLNEQIAMICETIENK